MRKRYGTLDKTDREQLENIAHAEPVWDGYLISKRARDRLREFGLVHTDGDGNNWLTEAGGIAADALGYLDG
jgi:hypothetical protein